MSSTLCLLLAVLPASRPSAAPTAKSPRFAAGAIVVVTKDAAPLMDGNRTVTTVKRGCRLQVTEVRDSWLKTKVYRADKPHLAWILNSNVRPYDVALDLANRVETGDAHFKARLKSLESSSDHKVRSAVKVAWINTWRESMLKVLDSKDDESLLTPEAFTTLLPGVDTLFRADDTLKRTAVGVLHTPHATAFQARLGRMAAHARTSKWGAGAQFPGRLAAHSARRALPSCQVRAGALGSVDSAAEATPHARSARLVGANTMPAPLRRICLGQGRFVVQRQPVPVAGVRRPLAKPSARFQQVTPTAAFAGGKRHHGLAGTSPRHPLGPRFHSKSPQNTSKSFKSALFASNRLLSHPGGASKSPGNTHARRPRQSVSCSQGTSPWSAGELLAL